MTKLIRERNQILRHADKVIKLSVSAERLFVFGIIFFILCHITSCLWFLLAKMYELKPDTWVMRYSYQDSSNYEVYIYIYIYIYILDIYCRTILHSDNNNYSRIWRYISLYGKRKVQFILYKYRIFAMLLMIIGVMSYSFAIGSLSNVLSSLDSQTAKLKEKFQLLDIIDQEYNLSTELYMNLRRALKFEVDDESSMNLDFTKKLPHNLKIQLSKIIHAKIVETFPFFRDQRPEFVAYIGPLLKTNKFQKGDYIYVEGDPVDQLYFLLKGNVDMVLTEHDDLPFVQIHPGIYIYIYIYRVLFWGDGPSEHYNQREHGTCSTIYSKSSGRLRSFSSKQDRPVQSNRQI